MTGEKKVFLIRIHINISKAHFLHENKWNRVPHVELNFIGCITILHRIFGGEQPLGEYSLSYHLMTHIPTESSQWEFVSLGRDRKSRILFH